MKAKNFNVLDLFSGIGGFSLGLERAGMRTVAFVEIDEFCQKVLKKHWPDVPVFSDIRNFSKEVFNERVDLICGGFPCQPFSVAGKRKGKEDNRYLWDEMFRVIQDFKPRWVIAENVYGILSIERGVVFEQVCIDLESEGYEVQPFIIPACAVGAPHRRDRVWIIAYCNCMGWEERGGENIRFKEQVSDRQDFSNFNTERVASNPTGERLARWRENREGYVRQQDRDECNQRGNWEENWYEVATRFCRMDDGISNRVDRLRCLGNAVVPQIVEIIGKTIIRVENEG